MKLGLAAFVLLCAAVFVTADLHNYPLPFWKAAHPALDAGELALPWESFFSVFGVIYAILGGFLLLKALERFSALSRSVEAEINALQDVRDYLIYFEPGQPEARRSILTGLEGYVRHIREVEWEQMAKAHRKRQGLNSDTCEELQSVIGAVRGLKAEGFMQETALQGLMTRLADVTTHRTQRIGIVYDQLPKNLKVLLGFLSVILLLSFILMPVAVPAIHLGMVAAVTVAAFLVFTIILDLDTPFEGTWNISRKPLEDAIVELRRHLGRV